MTSTYRILFLGDFHFGESYSRGRIIDTVGYKSSLVNLHPFVDSADFTIANFASPIVDPAHISSPLEGKQRYIHWADPRYNGPILRWLGVDAVSLANNHAMDYGRAGLESTMHSLAEHGIPWFGAGRDYREAIAPLTVPIPNRLGTGSLTVHGMFQASRNQIGADVYASDGTAVLATLQRSNISDLTPGSPDMDFPVAYPHWARGYRGRSRRQKDQARALSEVGYRAVIGHGSRVLQGAGLVGSTPVFYSIGNGVFNTRGGFARMDPAQAGIPYSAWTILSVTRDGDSRTVRVDLYPVYANNRETNFLPSPVAEADFSDIADFLDEQPEGNAPLPFVRSKDDLGYHLSLELGDWKILSPPAHTADTINTSTFPVDSVVIDLAAEIPDLPEPNSFEDEVSHGMLAQMAEYRRSCGTVILAQAAAQDGAVVEWITTNLAIATHNGQDYLLSAHRGPETPIGARVVKDKLLTKEFLENAGVPTPRGKAVTSVSEAIEFQHEIRRPVVIKPRRGSTGKGVAVNLTNHAEIHKAFHAARAHGEVMVEEFIDKVSEYRCLASATTCVSVTQRLLPTVVGDGESSIEELIRSKNRERQLTISTRDRPTPIDEETKRTLSQQGHSLDDVLVESKRLIVRDIGGLSSGGEPFERTQQVSDSVKKIAIEATAAIPGLNWAGSDVVVDSDGAPYIIEINTSADISGATFPLYGQPVALGNVLWGKILDSPTLPPAQSERAGRRTRAKSVSQVLFLCDNEPLRLDAAFGAALRDRGLAVEEFANSLRKVETTDGVRWFADSGSLGDRLSAALAARRHEVVHRLLTRKEALRPRARTRLTASKFRALESKLGGEWTVVNGRRPWPGRESVRVYSGQEVDYLELKQFRYPVWQALPPGRLLRIVSSPSGALLILSPEKHPRINVDEVNARAAAAVQAVPHLSIIGVDLLVTRRGRLLVEGLNPNPVLHPDWWVLGGSFDDVWDYLLNTPAMD